MLASDSKRLVVFASSDVEKIMMGIFYPYAGKTSSSAPLARLVVAEHLGTILFRTCMPLARTASSVTTRTLVKLVKQPHA